MSEVRSIRLICTGTDRGRHRPRPVLVWRLPADITGLTAATLVPTPGSWLELSPCDKCRRQPRIGPDTITSEIEAALATLRSGEWSVVLDIRDLCV